MNLFEVNFEIFDGQHSGQEGALVPLPTPGSEGHQKVEQSYCFKEQFW